MTYRTWGARRAASRQPTRWIIALLVAADLLCALSLAPCVAAGHAMSSGRPQAGGSSVSALNPLYLQWLRVDPQHPRRLYIGGMRRCLAPDPMSRQWCPPWVAVSRDGGGHWRDLSAAIGLHKPVLLQTPDGGQTPEALTLAPLILGVGGQALYLTTTFWGITASGSGRGVLASPDAGAHWIDATAAILAGTDPAFGGYGGGAGPVAVSPVRPLRAYALRISGDDSAAPTVVVTDDGGRHWRTASAPRLTAGTAPSGGRLLPDLQQANRVYFAAGATTLLRSEDTGRHWATVRLPPSVHTFTAGLDPYSGNALVLTPHGRWPTDRRYLSHDGGRTWHIAVCPGDHRGVCPTYRLHALGTNGASAGIFADGIYQFKGSGPSAGLPLAGRRLPVPLAGVRSLAAGLKAGDPIYVLTAPTPRSGVVRGTLYRSLDGARTWQRLTISGV